MVKKKKSNKLNLGGGVVNTTRITSKGILFAGKKHYNSEHIQRYRGREVLVHEVGGCMKTYLYDDGGKTLGRLLCVHDMSTEKPVRIGLDHPASRKICRHLRERKKDENFYSDLITQKIEAQTLSEDLIQKMSKERPDVVLACIGIHHPASEVVFQYLSTKVYQEWEAKDPALLVNPWSEIIKRRVL